MSSGGKLPLEKAWGLARQAAYVLGPHVLRVEIVGSVRRECLWVGDVELVAEPKRRTADLFGGTAPDLEPIRQALQEIGTWVKGGDRYMKVDHIFGSSLSLDLFLVIPPAEWGSILAIRTGPRELGRECVTRMRRHGYRHEAGRVVEIQTGKPVPVPTEEDFFLFAGVACMPARLRDAQAQRLLMEAREDRQRTK